MATSRLPQFEANAARAREMIGLGVAFTGLTSGSVDATDMYRAALVQGVAALDSYVHDVVLDLAVEILKGLRSPGSASRIGLHFGAVSDLVAAPEPVEFELRAREVVNHRLSTETFQKPDDIARAFSIVGVKGLWGGAFGAGTTITKSLSIVVNRRNQIVHRCDVDPAGVISPLPISDSDALTAVSTIEAVVRGIDAFV